MAIQYNKIFAIYDKTVGTDAARRLIWHYNGNYGTAGEADERPVAGVQYNSTTEGWVALDTLPVAPRPAWAETGTVQANTVYINVTGATASTVTEPASIQERQRSVQQLITSRQLSVAWTQRADSKLTAASRQAFASYITALQGIPQAQSSTWLTNPEGVTYPTEPSPVFTTNGADLFTQAMPTSLSETIEDDFASYGGNGTITYPAATGMTGLRVIRVATGSRGLTSPKRTRFDRTKLFRVEARARLVAAYTGTATMSFGAALLDASGVSVGEVWPILNKPQTSGGTAPVWVVGTFQTFVGYIRGSALAAADNEGTVRNPSIASNNTVQLAPRFKVNATTTGALTVTTGGATIEVDYIDIQEVEQDIAKDQIGANQVGTQQLNFADFDTHAPEFLMNVPDTALFDLKGNTGAATIDFVTSPAPRSGGYALKMTKTGAPLNNGIDFHVVSKPVNIFEVEADAYYGWEIWMHGQGTAQSGFFAQVVWLTANLQEISTTTLVNNYGMHTLSWQVRDGQVRAPANAAFAMLRLAMLDTVPVGNIMVVDSFRFRRALNGQTIAPRSLTRFAISTLLGEGISGDEIITNAIQYYHLNDGAATRLGRFYNNYTGANITYDGTGVGAQYAGGVAVGMAGGQAHGIWCGEVGVTSNDRADMYISFTRDTGGGEVHFATAHITTPPQVPRSCYTVFFTDEPGVASLNPVTYRWRASRRTGSPGIPQLFQVWAEAFGRWS